MTSPPRATRTLSRATGALSRATGTLSRALAACLFLAGPAAGLTLSADTVFAQTAPQVTSKISEPEVEVGEPFTVELKAMSDSGETVSRPELRPPGGFSVSGPMISPQIVMQFGGGMQRSQQGIGATWTLVASGPGTFTIPAPSIEWNGKRLKATPLSVKVVPQGTRPPRQQGGFLFPGGSPFGGVFPYGSGNDDDELPKDANLDLARAPANDVFLHAVADKKSAVVGEQVTISVYRYFTRSSFARSAETTPMALKDFLQYQLTSDAGAQSTFVANAGSQKFYVRLVERYAGFPLKTGTLKTGSYLESYVAWSGRSTFRRVSEDLPVIVTEPPPQNRPAGYRLGDVGQFQLSALVQPRKIEEGGSVAVNVRVTGSGNFPPSLVVPEKTGIEWLDPEKKEAIETRNGEISGSRSFGYVVRVTRTGTIDLGTIELSYWNPRARRYEVARSALGTVDVTPSRTAPVAPTASPTASAAPGGDNPFASLPPPPSKLPAFTPPAQAPLLEGASFPFALAAPPVLALAGIAGLELSRRARKKLAGRKTSPRTLANAALADARKAKGAGDERAAAAAVERAVVLAIEAASGVKARGILKEELASELAANGLSEPLAARASEMLAACDRARFDPLAAADVKLADAASLVADLLGKGA